MGLTVTAVNRILHGSVNEPRGFPMRAYRSLSHAKWDGKYPAGFIPKRRKQVI